MHVCIGSDNDTRKANGDISGAAITKKNRFKKPHNCELYSEHEIKGGNGQLMKTHENGIE